MRQSGDNVRIQVAINGVDKATAGLESLGVLSFNLSCAWRDPDTAPPQTFSQLGHAHESYRGGIPQFGFGALDVSNQLSVEWLRNTLNVGDELVIKILPPGEIDVPDKQTPRKTAPTRSQQQSEASKKTEPHTEGNESESGASTSKSRRKPVWIQYSQEPECCGRQMEFVGQIDDNRIGAEAPVDAKLWWHDAARFYVFTCAQCLNCKAVGQQY